MSKDFNRWTFRGHRRYEDWRKYDDERMEGFVDGFRDNPLPESETVLSPRFYDTKLYTETYWTGFDARLRNQEAAKQPRRSGFGCLAKMIIAAIIILAFVAVFVLLSP